MTQAEQEREDWEGLVRHPGWKRLLRACEEKEQAILGDAIFSKGMDELAGHRGMREGIQWALSEPRQRLAALKP